jgi:hypothetical protein
MKSTKQLLITTLLAFAILANISVGSVYATGNLDDEEEEDVLEELQSQVQTLNEFIQDTPCGQGLIGEQEQPEEEAEEEQQPEESEESNGCGSEESEKNDTVVEELPPVEQNETQTCNVQPEPEPEPTCNLVGPEPEQNVTEEVEELVQNVTDEIIPFLPVINVTEPVQEEEQPQCNLTQTNEEEQPVQNNVTEGVETLIQNGTEIAEIEFDIGCACFILDSQPEQGQ